MAFPTSFEEPIFAFEQKYEPRALMLDIINTCKPAFVAACKKVQSVCDNTKIACKPKTTYGNHAHFAYQLVHVRIW